MSKNYVTQQQMRRLKSERSSQGGGVSSVSFEMPTGFEVEGSPVTSRGTITVSMAEGYGIVKFVTAKPSPSLMEPGVLYAVIK